MVFARHTLKPARKSDCVFTTVCLSQEKNHADTMLGSRDLLWDTQMCTDTVRLLVWNFWERQTVHSPLCVWVTHQARFFQLCCECAKNVVTCIVSSGHGFICCTLKPLAKANGTFATLCLSEELVKQFVELTRQSSLSWQKKCSHMMFRSWDLPSDTQTCTHTVNVVIWNHREGKRCIHHFALE